MERDHHKRNGILSRIAAKRAAAARGRRGIKMTERLYETDMRVPRYQQTHHIRECCERTGEVFPPRRGEWSNPNDEKPCFCGSPRPHGRSFCAGCEADSIEVANA